MHANIHPQVRRRVPARRFLALGLAITLGAVVLAGCTGGGSSDRLTIYSGRLPELIGPLLEDFADETGIGIDVRYGDSSDLALLLDEEGDKSPADVFISQSPGAMGYLDGKQQLQPLSDGALEGVASRFRASDGDWVGLSARARVLVYNPDLVSQADLPASIFDLTKAKYRDKVGLAPTNASFQDFVTAMRELAGEADTKNWLVGMKSNGARSYANNLALVDAVGRGEIPMGLVNDYYLFEAQAEDPGIPARNYFFPGGDLGTVILATTAGILKTSDKTADAERLIEFLHSKRAQRFFADKTFEYPLVAGVEPAEGKPPLDSIQSPRLDLDSLGGGLTRTREIIAASGLEQS